MMLLHFGPMLEEPKIFFVNIEIDLSKTHLLGLGEMKTLQVEILRELI